MREKKIKEEWKIHRRHVELRSALSLIKLLLLSRCTEFSSNMHVNVVVMTTGYLCDVASFVWRLYLVFSVFTQTNAIIHNNQILPTEMELLARPGPAQVLRMNQVHGFWTFITFSVAKRTPKEMQKTRKPHFLRTGNKKNNS